MDQIMELAKARGLMVIEDCAQASGALFRGRPVGGLGHAGAFSFCQDKIITTGGEGGLLVTNDEGIWRDAWSFKDHGKNYDAVYHREHPPGFRWLHDSFGTNWRMTEMQAAIGRIQLRKLPDWTARRAANAGILRDGLAHLTALRIPDVPGHIGHAWYKFYAFVRPDALRSGWTRDRIMVEIAEKGVPASVGSCPEVYLEKAFTLSGMGLPTRLPVARELGETSLAFLVHPTLTPECLQVAVEVIQDVVTRATR
jgi:dTDP-4-amino-4,6-dideoxygalactose transaminase